MTDEELWEIVFRCAGAATSPLLEDHPGYTFPAERVSQAVREELARCGRPQPPDGRQIALTRCESCEKPTFEPVVDGEGDAFCGRCAQTLMGDLLTGLDGRARAIVALYSESPVAFTGRPDIPRLDGYAISHDTATAVKELRDFLAGIDECRTDTTEDGA